MNTQSYSRYGEFPYANNMYNPVPAWIQSNKRFFRAMPYKESVDDDGETNIKWDTEHPDWDKEIGLSDAEWSFFTAVMQFKFDYAGSGAMPGIKSIAQIIGKTYNSTWNIKRGLEEKGALICVNRFRTDSGTTTSLYDFSPFIAQMAFYEGLRFFYPEMFEVRDSHYGKSWREHNDRGSLFRHRGGMIFHGEGVLEISKQKILHLKRKDIKENLSDSDFLKYVRLFDITMSVIIGRSIFKIIDQYDIQTTDDKILAYLSRLKQIVLQADGSEDIVKKIDETVGDVEAIDNPYELNSDKPRKRHKPTPANEIIYTEPPKKRKKTPAQQERDDWCAWLMIAINDMSMDEVQRIMKEPEFYKNYGDHLAWSKKIRNRLKLHFPNREFNPNILVDVKDWLEDGPKYQFENVSYKAILKYIYEYINDHHKEKEEVDIEEIFKTVPPIDEIERSVKERKR